MDWSYIKDLDEYYKIYFFKGEAERAKTTSH